MKSKKIIATLVASLVISNMGGYLVTLSKIVLEFFKG